MHNTRWSKPINVTPPEGPDWFWQRYAVTPWMGTVSTEVGEEVLLYMNDPSDGAKALSELEPFRLLVEVGSLQTQHGLLGFILFVVPEPDGQRQEAFAAWESFFNPSDASMTAPYLALSSQTHWHVVICGSGPTVLKVLEFENEYGLERPLTQLRSDAKVAPCTNFEAAVKEAQDTHSMSDLYQLATNQQEQSFAGLIRELIQGIHTAVLEDDQTRTVMLGKLLHDNGGAGLIRFALNLYRETYGSGGKPERLQAFWRKAGLVRE